jgi:hypothetical protein
MIFRVPNLKSENRDEISECNLLNIFTNRYAEYIEFVLF